MKKKSLLEIPDSERSAEEWAVSEILRCGDSLNARLNEALKPHGISFPQYSVLRILGRQEEAVSSGLIGGQMTTHDSDVTRLVGRLVERGLVTRRRDPADRRVVKVGLTPAGRELVDRLDGPTLGLIERCFAGIKPKRVRRVVEVLRRVRNASD